MGQMEAGIVDDGCIRVKIARHVWSQRPGVEVLELMLCFRTWL
jgi:hypothetical protein